jgi:hypothetical protein
MIFESASKIISRELSSFTPEFRSQVIAGKRLRNLFLDHSLEGLDSSFVDCITKKITKTT